MKDDIFDSWLKSICFKEPTKEAYDLARMVWNQATIVERRGKMKMPKIKQRKNGQKTTLHTEK